MNVARFALPLLLMGCPSADPGDPTPAAERPPLPSADPADWPSPGEPCGLTTDILDPRFLEGDTVAFELRCADGDLDDFDLAPIALPDDGELTGTSFRWDTGSADGGRYDLVFSVRPADGPDAVPVAESVTFWVADDPLTPGNLGPSPHEYTEEWGIPVFHVDVQGEVSQSYEQAEVTFQGRTYDAFVKVRGASSTAYPKRSYTLEFEAEELPVEPWGVTRDHLYLVTSFDDNSYVRQKLIYDQWQAIADFWETPRLAPRTFFTVLYLDGVYQGLYTAIDRPDNEFVDHMGYARDGNLYKSVNHDANFYVTRANGSNKSTPHDGYEKKEGPDGDWSDLDAFVTWAAGSSDEAVYANAEGWYDVQEFMDWFLLVHYSEAGDSAGKNAYLHNDPLEPRFHMHPWDFNHCWGQDWRTYRIPSSARQLFDNRNRIFTAFHEVDAANDEMWARFAAMREPGGPFSEAWLTGRLDDYYELIDRSATRDWQLWGDAYRSFGRWEGRRTNEGDWQDYEGEKDYVYSWIVDRESLFRTVVP